MRGTLWQWVGETGGKSLERLFLDFGRSKPCRFMHFLMIKLPSNLDLFILKTYIGHFDILMVCFIGGV